MSNNFFMDDSWKNTVLSWILPLFLFLLIHDAVAVICLNLIQIIRIVSDSPFWTNNQMLLASSIGNVAGLIFLIFWIKKTKETVSPKQKKPWLIWSIIVGMSACLCFNGILILSGLTQLFATDYNETTDLIYGNTFLLTLLFTGILAPVVEELLYRHIVYRQLQKQFDFWQSCLVSSLIFGIAHLAIVQGIYGVLTGILLCYAYEYRNGLKSSITIHIAMNVTSIIITQILSTLSSTVGKIVFTTSAILGTIVVITCIISNEKRLHITNQK